MLVLHAIEHEHEATRLDCPFQWMFEMRKQTKTNDNDSILNDTDRDKTDRLCGRVYLKVLLYVYVGRSLSTIDFTKCPSAY